MHRYISATAIAICLLIAFPFSAAATGSPDRSQHTQIRQQALDAILARAVSNNALPGAVAGIANSAGTLYLGAAGKRNLESGAEMRADTIIAIASMTKAVTTVALLQLAERGLLELDAPVSSYVAELADLRVLEGFDDDGQAQLVDAPSVPTIRQLLTHTSGYVYEIWNAQARRSVESGDVASLFEGREGLSAPLAFAPGERWEYGIGLDWAGIVVERVAGKALDVYFKEHIFEPLKMFDTGYLVSPSKSSRVAVVYARTDTGLQPIPAPTPEVLGGGGLYSTVADYLRFMRALLNEGALDGARILNQETVDSMFNNQIGSLVVSPGKSQMVAVSNDFDMGFGAPAKWGLGFLLHETGTPAGRPAGSASWGGLYNSYFWIDRENDLCAVVATQLLPFYDERSVELLKDVESSVYAREN